MKSWRCTNCGFVTTRDRPPEHCPVCGEPASDFRAFDPRATHEAPQGSADPGLDPNGHGLTADSMTVVDAGEPDADHKGK